MSLRILRCPGKCVTHTAHALTPDIDNTFSIWTWCPSLTFLLHKVTTESDSWSRLAATGQEALQPNETSYWREFISSTTSNNLPIL